MLTQNKDADKLILQEMNDKTLMNMCIASKYVNELCKDEFFWRNRFLNRFAPSEIVTKLALTYRPQNMSWKKYYLMTVIEIEEMKNILGQITMRQFAEDGLYLTVVLSKYFLDKFAGVERKGVEKKLRDIMSFNPHFSQNMTGEAGIAVRKYLIIPNPRIIL